MLFIDRSPVDRLEEELWKQGYGNCTVELWKATNTSDIFIVNMARGVDLLNQSSLVLNLTFTLIILS